MIMNLETLKTRLEWAEGREHKPYKCSSGKWSIGLGRNLEDIGLSLDEILLILRDGVSDEIIDCLAENDIERTLVDCRSFPYWERLTDTRRVVVADCIYNMGLSVWKKFVKTNAALSRGDWQKASAELLDSTYARQVGRRAVANAFALRHDRFPTNEELWMLME